MSSPAFEWDSGKAIANLKDHGVSFEEALTVFQDPLAKVHADPDHSIGERREILLGHSIEGRLLLVSFTQRGGKIRLISARTADRRDAKAMKKIRKASRATSDDLRPHYDFDYSKAKPNPYVARLKGRVVAVVLDPDVAAAFPTEAVNKKLRSVLAAIPRRSKRFARKR